MKRLALVAVVLGAVAAVPAEATIVGFSADLSSLGSPAMIIPAPGSVFNSVVFNTGQQGFNESQGVLLVAPLLVDGGSIAATTVVDSHMIFLNREDGLGGMNHTVTWTFSGNILGVMSNTSGSLEDASTPILGAPGTLYPAAFGNRGLEGADAYLVSGNQLTLRMQVTQPGDWVRVVTEPVPEPGTMLLIGSGLAGMALRRRRR